MRDLAPEARAGFLGSLAPAELDDLWARGRRRILPAGTHLCLEGSRSDRVHVVLGGRVKVAWTTEHGQEVILALRGPGDLIGELSAIDDEPTSAMAVALERVDALVVPAESFRAFLEEHPRVALLLLRLVTARLRDADRKRVEFGAYDTTGRAARRIAELAERFGRPTASGLEIELPITQEEMSAWLGASREAVSKALRTLREQGCIETSRKRIVVRDLDGLRRRGS